MVEITWWDVYNGWRTELTPTDAIGLYMYDLTNYSDGGVVYINATFDAPYNNRGYNYTYIDVGMGMSIQEVVCGVPYDVLIINPLPMNFVPSGIPFVTDYIIVDRDGMLAQGYFTHGDGPMDWVSTDPLFVPPPSAFFDGTADPTPGQRTELLTLWTPPQQWIEVYEGGIPGNQYLTPWGEFYIDPDSLVPGWLKDWDFIPLVVM